MSAPTTSDPLVVTTADGTSWWRRAVTQDGRGLYAVAGACNCPPYLMSTLATLAEHGIRGQADVLPMPGGPEPQVPDVDRSADKLTRLLAPTQALREDDPNGLHHTYRVGRDLPETGGA